MSRLVEGHLTHGLKLVSRGFQHQLRDPPPMNFLARFVCNSEFYLGPLGVHSLAEAGILTFCVDIRLA